MLRFVRHAISLAEAADGQLALLVRLQLDRRRRAAELMSEARFSAVITLMQRIRWFEWGRTRIPLSTITRGSCSTKTIPRISLQTLFA